MSDQPITDASDQDRNAVIEQILKENFLCFVRPLPEQSVANSMIAAWTAVLAEIPTEDLYNMYLAAMRSHKGPELLSAPEIVEAWRWHGIAEMMRRRDENSGEPK